MQAMQAQFLAFSFQVMKIPVAFCFVAHLYFRQPHFPFLLQVTVVYHPVEVIHPKADWQVPCIRRIYKMEPSVEMTVKHFLPF